MKRIRRKSFIIASLLQFSKHWGQNFDITQNLQNVDTIKIYKAQLYWITVSTLDQREYKEEKRHMMKMNFWILMHAEIPIVDNALGNEGIILQ